RNALTSSQHRWLRRLCRVNIRQSLRSARDSSRSLHDALPISALTTARVEEAPSTPASSRSVCAIQDSSAASEGLKALPWRMAKRSEEHTSELQSRENLVCRLLREKKKARASSFVFF